jgi:hypothetical protein
VIGGSEEELLHTEPQSLYGAAGNLLFASGTALSRSPLMLA